MRDKPILVFLFSLTLSAFGSIPASVKCQDVNSKTKVTRLPDDSKRARNDAALLNGSIDLDALAARGEALANEDPLALDLRNEALLGSPKYDYGRGFDIGMGAAEGQTLPGPGKKRVRDSLTPTARIGFDAAVSFSLERNRNADLASKGASIAKVDPLVAKARNTQPDDPPLRFWFEIFFYRLGFDIATGIFGDPALGARGNTALGPGSLKIRGSLSAAGQRGFDASVKLHLSRNYKQ